MTSLHQSKPASKPLSRSVRFVERDAQTGSGIVRMILTYKNRSEVYFYLYQRHDAGESVAFRLVQVLADGSPMKDLGPDAECYDICLDGHGCCDCLGYLRHSHCKHISAGLSLLAAGQIGGGR